LVQRRDAAQRQAWGRWFAARLRERGLSQVEFARRAGMSAGQVGRWATGRQLPTVESARRIAVTLHATTDDVLAAAGLVAIETQAPPHLVRFLSLLNRVNWSAERIATLQALLAAWIELDRGVDAAPADAAEGRIARAVRETAPGQLALGMDGGAARPVLGIAEPAEAEGTIPLAEAARRLGLSERMLAQLAERGEFPPALPFGDGWMVDVAALGRYVRRLAGEAGER